jgi:membrane-bound lytic murein transglycosylase A
LQPKPDNSRRRIALVGCNASGRQRCKVAAVICAAAWAAGPCLTGSAWAAGIAEPIKIADSQLEPVRWSDLQGWTADDHLAAFAAYRTSCQALKSRPASEERTLEGALREICHRAVMLRPQTDQDARTFFEENFLPVRIARVGEAEGLLTGYYEPIVQGSRFPNPEFHFPLYRRPPDLVAVGHERGPFPNRGALVGRRNHKGEIVPYYDRAAIEAGALDGQRLEICWLRDAFDVMNIQIQGSARVILEDGTPLRVNYDAHNGYPYGSVGRVLIDRNLIPREQMSMQRIREWMAAHPDQAPAIRAANRAYVFFRITGLSHEGDPVGAQGVPLTAGRSIAVDRMHVYGTPFFIEAALPIESGKSASSFHRLMVAQDTGSAIIGPARADLYWGAGDDAGRLAGRIRHAGRFVMLLPRDLDMIEAGRQMPLPMPKPNSPEHVPTEKLESAIPLPIPKPQLLQNEAERPISAKPERKARRVWRWPTSPARLWGSW